MIAEPAATENPKGITPPKRRSHHREQCVDSSRLLRAVRLAEDVANLIVVTLPGRQHDAREVFLVRSVHITMGLEANRSTLFFLASDINLKCTLVSKYPERQRLTLKLS